MEDFNGTGLLVLMGICLIVGMLLAVFVFGTERPLNHDEICQLKGFDESDTKYGVTTGLASNVKCLKKDYTYKGLSMSYCEMPIYVEDSADNWCKQEAIKVINEIQKVLIFTRLTNFKKPDNNIEIIIQENMLKFPLTLRTAIKNDRYIKINSNINMSVFEMIRSQGIPVQLRNLCPVLTNSGNEIIWVLGTPIANKFKIINKKSKEILLKINLGSS